MALVVFETRGPEAAGWQRQLDPGWLVRHGADVFVVAVGGLRAWVSGRRVFVMHKTEPGDLVRIDEGGGSRYYVVGPAGVSESQAQERVICGYTGLALEAGTRVVCCGGCSTFFDARLLEQFQACPRCGSVLDQARVEAPEEVLL